MSKIRLFINRPKITVNDLIKITDKDFNYLIKVMRQKINHALFIFNGVDGEFEAKITEINKRDLQILVTKKNSEIQQLPQVTLAFAPVKNVRIDFVAAKSCEMGVTSFCPILTQHTIVRSINNERFVANIKEACEQCGRNDIPALQEVTKLTDLISQNNSDDKIIILCDESGKGKKASKILPKIDFDQKEIIILIGPEGGFSPDEFTQLYQVQNLYPISLGSRILRADTATIAALALVQEFI